MIASVGRSIDGSATLSTRTSRLPWKVRAFMVEFLLGSFAGRSRLGHQSVSLGLRPVRNEAPAVSQQAVDERSRDDALLALHEGVEALPRHHCGIVLLLRCADAGVLHLRAPEEVRLRRA